MSHAKSPRRWSLLRASLILAVAVACGGEPREPGSGPVCWTLARLPGPEDLVVDPGPPRRLLVSSQDRRQEPRPNGEIWSVPLDPAGKARKLRLLGRRDRCSFHPHGIDLVKNDQGRRLLYVLNHHDAEDSDPARGCFDTARDDRAPGGEVSSVEVFEVVAGGLRFLQRLADPAVLGRGNDLVGLPNGDLWVTDPPAGGLGMLRDVLGWSPVSKVAHFRCDSRVDRRCVGSWQTVRIEDDDPKQPIRYANGIAYRCAGEDADGRCGDGEAGHLYVASFMGKRLHPFKVQGRGELVAQRPIPLDFGPDNLTWAAGSDRPTLLVAGHPDSRRFLQHGRWAGQPSPSTVVAVDVSTPVPSPVPLFHDEGSLLSAVSVAACVDGDLALGQVFEKPVLRCRAARGCGEPVSR